jgi:serine/threonine-protein kinase
MSKTGKGTAQLKFGRYNALTKLGQGAMATVYLAEDPALNRMVAIKVIHSHLSSNASLLDRFTVEAKTAASLRNPNIVEIFDYGIQDHGQYLVMEYIDGPNLQFVLNLLGGQPIAPEVCAAIICQAADGLVTAEKFGVVHRDIKPENMMFKSEGVLKIADFGIAHISEQNMTQTGSILGSPNFMSPEQVEGKKPTHFTDMFSLGAVFYYCMTGRKPFSGANIPTIMRHICDMPHEPVGSVLPGADPFLENLVDTLLQKEPEQRGKGARWLSLQLRGYLNQKGLLDLTEATRDFLEKTGGQSGNQTVVDLTPAPAGDEPSGKTPMRPGMKAERPTAGPSAKPGTGVRPGTGIRPGTGVRPGTGIRPGTWQAGGPGGDDVDFSGSRPPAGNGKKNALMWVGGGVAAFGLLAAALFVVLGNGKDTSGGNAGSAAADPKPVVQSGKVVSVALQPGAMELQAGQKRKFLLDVQPAGAPAGVRWESADPSIASVQDGEVWGQKPGQTTIRAISLQDSSKQGVAEIVVAGAQAVAANPEPDPMKPKSRPVPENPGARDPGSASTATDKPAADKPASGKAFLTIVSAPPFAEVIVDGKFMGTTPVKGKELAPGKHKLFITHRSFPSIDTTINLGPGEKSLRFRLFN